MSDSSQTNGVSSQQEVKQVPAVPAQQAAPVQAAPAPTAPVQAAPAAPVNPVNAPGQQAPQQATQAQAPTPQAAPLQAPPPAAPAQPANKAALIPEASVQPPETEPDPAPPSKREIEAQNLLNLRDLTDEEVNSLELHQLLKAKARAIGVCEENDTSELTPEERTRMSWAIHSDTQVTLEHIPHQVFFQKVWCLGPSERLDTLVRNLTGSSHYRSGGDHITILDMATHSTEE